MPPVIDSRAATTTIGEERRLGITTSVLVNNDLEKWLTSLDASPRRLLFVDLDPTRYISIFQSDSNEFKLFCKKLDDDTTPVVFGLEYLTKSELIAACQSEHPGSRNPVIKFGGREASAGWIVPYRFRGKLKISFRIGMSQQFSATLDFTGAQCVVSSVVRA